ncbi:MAG: VOC family protein [Acidimicrobiia bacterium]
MTAIPYYHIGILVPDLDEAVERFSDVLGVTFADRVYQDSQHFDDGGVLRDLRLHLTYSIDGPPYYELIEAQGDEGLYSIKHGAGLHHVGIWEPDPTAKREEYYAKGMTHEATIYRPDGSIIVTFFDPEPLGGVRIEFANLDLKEGHESWLTGGDFVR